MRPQESLHLAIVIPAWDEAPWLPKTIAELPSEVAGFSKVTVIVVDDGSTDGTAEAARKSGADIIVANRVHRGLARTWATGIQEALRQGADVVVHTDADGQYRSSDIERLIAPLMDGGADLVVGARPIRDIEHFSRGKRLLQRLGSWAVRLASGTSVPDAPSGFRAMTAETARRLNVFGSYTYTIETLIQAGRSGLRVVSVPIGVERTRRPSRLITSIPSYVWRSAVVIVRVAVLYRPFRFFASVGAILLGVAFILAAARLLCRVPGCGIMPDSTGLVIVFTLVSAVQFFLTAFLADAIAASRRLNERILEQSLRSEGTGSAGSSSN